MSLAIPLAEFRHLDREGRVQFVRRALAGEIELDTADFTAAWKFLYLTRRIHAALTPEEVAAAFARCSPARFMSAKDRAALAALPQRLTIWRGSHGCEPSLAGEGWSWALSFERAVGYAMLPPGDTTVAGVLRAMTKAMLSREIPERANMVRGEVARSAIFAYVTKGERLSEVIVSPNQVENLTAVSLSLGIRA